jgi:hypothetical protein
VAQGGSSPALSHYALVKSLERGTAIIDETRYETGSQWTYDVSYFDGHYYANKAPGLALVVVPVYALLDATGVRTTGDPLFVMWALTVVGVGLPALLLLLLVRSVSDRVEPGFGTAAAVTLGLGTLLTPFATVLFPHVLSALLVFAAFVLLFTERQGPTRLVLVACAGLAAGYAVTTEYHNVFAAAVLGVYAVSRSPRLRRALVYAGGAFIGVAPLLVYNWWAFGSPVHLSYVGSVLLPGQTGHDVQLEVGSSLGAPDLTTLVSLLVSKWGLLTAAPVLALGVAGTVLLYKRGFRTEALVVAAIVSVYLLYNAAFFDPFGAVPPGPRYLMPIVPFVAFPLALMFRAFPVLTSMFAGASILVATSVTFTRPHIAWDGDVVYRLWHPTWWSPTIVDLAGHAGWYRVLPLPIIVLIAVICAVAVTPRPSFSARDVAGALIALVAWLGVVGTGTTLLDDYGSVGSLGLVLLVVASAAAVAAAHRARRVYGGQLARK